MAPVVHGLWTPEDFHSAPSFKKNVVQADLKRMPLKKKKKKKDWNDIKHELCFPRAYDHF